MAVPESTPEKQPQSEPDRPDFIVVRGQGTSIWQQKPSDIGITEPISPWLFRDSKVMRFMRPNPTRVAFNRSVQTTPATTLTEILQDVLRRTVPHDDLEAMHMAEHALGEAHLAEQQFNEDRPDADPDEHRYLREVAAQHAGTLIMRGLDAFDEAAEDYDNGANAPTIYRARLFAAYLIDTATSE